MVRLVVGDVEAVLAPMVETAGTEIRNPHKLKSLFMDVRSYLPCKIGSAAHVFVHPIYALQLKVAVAFLRETLHKLVDEPAARRKAVVGIVKIERFAVKFAQSFWPM